MASPTSMSVVAVLLLALLAAAAAQPAPACYTRVFSFGDSLADTGNYRFVYGDDDPEPGLRLPYGETFFHNATGRFSNGRLIVDFIAEALGLPYVRAYLSGWSVEDFAFGANFAVGGAMALSMEFFSEHGVTLPKAYVDLDTQMDWFRFLLQSLCPDNLTDCADMMSKSLFLVGEIGGNDFNQPFLAGVPFEKIRTFTPSVVAKISSTITELIGLGAKTLLVPGNLPVGCTPYYLMTFKSDKAEDYEPRTGCIRWMNEFAQYHKAGANAPPGYSPATSAFTPTLTPLSPHGASARAVVTGCSHVSSRQLFFPSPFFFSFPFLPDRTHTSASPRPPYRLPLAPPRQRVASLPPACRPPNAANAGESGAVPPAPAGRAIRRPPLPFRLPPASFSPGPGR